MEISSFQDLSLGVIVPLVGKKGMLPTEEKVALAKKDTP